MRAMMMLLGPAACAGAVGDGDGETVAECEAAQVRIIQAYADCRTDYELGTCGSGGSWTCQADCFDAAPCGAISGDNEDQRYDFNACIDICKVGDGAEVG